MKIKYIPIFTDDAEKQINFFRDKLHLEISGTKHIFPGTEYTIFETGNDDVFIIIVPQGGYRSDANRLVLNTDDFLNDYHALKIAGVSFSNEPEYLPIGLGAEFSDPAGNKYLLVEERDYKNY